MDENIASNIYKKIQGSNNKAFFKRCWDQDQTVYENRIKAIDFKGLDRVLDAGCGFGQWSVALSKLNTQVESIEYDSHTQYTS